MSLVLYRKYRSQNFDELVGQQHIVSLIKNAVSQQQTAHAYLFHGPRGLGKTSTARILAKAVNCLQLQPDGNPCCKCASCVSIQNGSFLDLIEIDAASNRGIDQIRELKERIEFSPSEGKYKVYIIDEVHMLTTEAFNALLKTLEEPPAHAMMILATTEIYKVPATILSRCQRFDFRLGTDIEIAQLLQSVLSQENISIDDCALKLIVSNARGSYRDALSLLDVVVSGQLEGDDPKVITEEEVRSSLGLADSTMSYFFLEKLIENNGSEALSLVSELSSRGVNLGQFIKYVLSVLRDILLGEIKDDLANTEYSFAKKLDKQTTLKLINLFVDAERDMKDSAIPTLPLEILIAKSSLIFDLGNKENSPSDTPVGPQERLSGDDKKGSISDNHTKAGIVTNSDAKTKPRAKSDSNISKTDNKKNSLSKSIKGEIKEKVDTSDQKGKDKKSSSSVKDLGENVVSKRDESSIEKSGSLSLDDKTLKENWSTILAKLGDFNSHLYAFMGRSKVLGVEDGVLRLAVAFDFHKDRLEGMKSKEAISKVFVDLFGFPVKIACEVDNSIRATVTQSSECEIKAESDVEPEVISMHTSNSANTVFNNVAEVFGTDLLDV